MKSFIITLCVAILVISILGYVGRQGDAIKIYSTGRDIQSVVENLNYAVASDSISFKVVDTESDADVSVAFLNDIGNPRADAVSYAYRGQIDIANSAPDDSLGVILLHEILHCAGVGHEPDNPSSIMYVHTHKHGQLNPEQIRDLKRLSGIKAPERLIAQFRLFF